MENYPLISFILICYNQEDYIEEAVHGAFSQDYPNLEIIISDDCSTDETALIVERLISIYNGKHRVHFNRNKTNLGIVRNLNVSLTLAHGDYYVFAGGDDISLPNRVSISYKKLQEANTECLAINFRYINKNGEELNHSVLQAKDELSIYKLDEYLNGAPWPPCACKIVSKRLFDFFGPLREDCPTEDTTTSLRAILLGGIANYDAIGVKYRWHDSNISNRHNLYTKIDPIKIYHQYYTDIQTAHKKKVISLNTYKALLRIIKDYRATQILIRRLYLNKKMPQRVWYKLLYILNPQVLRCHRNLTFTRDLTK